MYGHWPSRAILGLCLAMPSEALASYAVRLDYSATAVGCPARDEFLKMFQESILWDPDGIVVEVSLTPTSNGVDAQVTVDGATRPASKPLPTCKEAAQLAIQWIETTVVTFERPPPVLYDELGPHYFFVAPSTIFPPLTLPLPRREATLDFGVGPVMALGRYESVAWEGMGQARLRLHWVPVSFLVQGGYQPSLTLADDRSQVERLSGGAGICYNGYISFVCLLGTGGLYRAVLENEGGPRSENAAFFSAGVRAGLDIPVSIYRAPLHVVTFANGLISGPNSYCEEDEGPCKVIEEPAPLCVELGLLLSVEVEHFFLTDDEIR